MKLVIVDMDGTLYSSDLRFQECQKISNGNRKEFWSCFQSEKFMYLDRPITSVVNYVKSIIDENTVVVIVTGRSEEQLGKTKEQLEKVGIIPAEIHMRKKGDFRKDFEFKTSVLRELLEKYKPEKTVVIDDSDDVLRSVKQNFPEVEVIDAKKLY